MEKIKGGSEVCFQRRRERRRERKRDDLVGIDSKKDDKILSSVIEVS